MLMVGDIGINILGLGDPLGFEDMDEGRPSQRENAALRFDAACSDMAGPSAPEHRTALALNGSSADAPRRTSRTKRGMQSGRN
jgi:hypothetical protein